MLSGLKHQPHRDVFRAAALARGPGADFHRVAAALGVRIAVAHLFQLVQQQPNGHLNLHLLQPIGRWVDESEERNVEDVVRSWHPHADDLRPDLGQPTFRILLKVTELPK